MLDPSEVGAGSPIEPKRKGGLDTSSTPTKQQAPAMSSLLDRLSDKNMYPRKAVTDGAKNCIAVESLTLRLLKLW